MDKKLFYKRNNSHISSQSSYQRIILSGYLLMFKILGLAPWKVEVSKIIRRDPGNPYKVSIYGYIYNIFLIFSLCIYLISLYMFDINPFDDLEPSQNEMVMGSIAGFGIISVIVIWLTYIFYQTDIVKIANDLYILEISIRKCKFYSPEKELFPYFIFIGNFVICSSIFIFEICVYFSSDLALWMIPNIINSWTLTQYTLFLNIIFLRFRSLNKMILKLGNINTEVEFDSICVPRTSVNFSAVIDAVQIINYQHARLCEISKRLAEFYALPILLAIIYFVATATDSLYIIFESFISRKCESFRIFLYVENSSMFFLTLFDFIALIVNTIRISREVKNIALYVHLLLDRCKEHLQVRETLIEFSRNLLLTNVGFTVYRIVDLDGFLLHSIAGTIMTYVIILIQFSS